MVMTTTPPAPVPSGVATGGGTTGNTRNASLVADTGALTANAENVLLTISLTPGVWEIDASAVLAGAGVAGNADLHLVAGTAAFTFISGAPGAASTRVQVSNAVCFGFSTQLQVTSAGTITLNCFLGAGVTTCVAKGTSTAGGTATGETCINAVQLA